MSRSITNSEPLIRVGHAIGFVLSLVVLALAHQHDWWRPMLGGWVTEAFAEVLWAVDLSLLTRAAGHAILVVARGRVLRAVFDLANALTGLVSTWVLYSVYPLALGGLDGPVRMFLVFVLLVSAIAVVVQAARLAYAPLEAEASN